MTTLLHKNKTFPQFFGKLFVKKPSMYDRIFRFCFSFSDGAKILLSRRILFHVLTFI